MLIINESSPLSDKVTLQQPNSDKEGAGRLWE